MLFVAGKLFWALAAPDNLLLLLLLAGLLAQALGRRRGYRVALAAALALLAAGILPIGQWAIGPLEGRFPNPVLPAHIDGIIVLGGAVEPKINAHGQVALDGAAARITEALALALRHPEAKLLLSGGDASLLPRPREREADETRRLFIELGVAPGRILVEDRSRNTFENALFSLKVAAPKPDETWVLVTSAWHMPRAVGCFRAVGWKVLPYPVDYRTETDPLPDFELGKQLALLDVAAKEWVGLVAYRLLGRTDALFPGP
ncbi:MAG TPA: YdcF family protein [Stellaceae bacterium]|nr:YdcF family protein [Stellaceae bacterium]